MPYFSGTGQIVGETAGYVPVAVELSIVDPTPEHLGEWSGTARPLDAQDIHQLAKMLSREDDQKLQLDGGGSGAMFLTRVDPQALSVEFKGTGEPPALPQGERQP